MTDIRSSTPGEKQTFENYIKWNIRTKFKKGLMSIHHSFAFVPNNVFETGILQF